MLSGFCGPRAIRRFRCVVHPRPNLTRPEEPRRLSGTNPEGLWGEPESFNGHIGWEAAAEDVRLARSGVESVDQRSK